jgi:hypothetical protein
MAVPDLLNNESLAAYATVSIEEEIYTPERRDKEYKPSHKGHVSVKYNVGFLKLAPDVTLRQNVIF